VDVEWEPHVIQGGSSTGKGQPELSWFQDRHQFSLEELVTHDPIGSKGWAALESLLLLDLKARDCLPRSAVSSREKLNPKLKLTLKKQP
jgi:hypothetical protein